MVASSLTKVDPTEIKLSYEIMFTQDRPNKSKLDIEIKIANYLILMDRSSKN